MTPDPAGPLVPNSTLDKGEQLIHVRLKFSTTHAYIEHEHVFLKQIILAKLIKEHTTQCGYSLTKF